MTIVVHIPYNNATEAYTRYYIEAMRRMAASPLELELQLHIVPYKSPCADSHSKAIREAFAAIEQKPDAVHVVCDSDTVVVMPKWDEVVKGILTQVDCFGTAYQDVGTKQTGYGKKQTYKGKPNVEWLALAPGKPWHLFEPAKTGGEDVLVQTRDDSDLYGLNVGFQVLADTCWNLPMFLRDQQLTSRVMPNVPNNSPYEEWQLDGVPFVIHQGKSRKNPFRATPYSRDFYTIADRATGVKA